MRVHRAEDERIEGEIIEIVERKTSTVVGTLDKSRHFFFVIPDDERFNRDIYVSPDDAEYGGSHHYQD